MCGITGIIDTPDMKPLQVRRGAVDGRLHGDPGPVRMHRRIDDVAG